jgi:uncharacterized coiled-coil DUF342 family protein
MKMHILTAEEVFAQRDRENPYKDHARQFQKAGSKNTRKSSTVQKELEDVRTRLSDSIRQLGEAEALRVELVKSLDKVTSHVAAIRAEGCHESKLHEYIGYNFYSKTNDKSEHHPGSIEIMQGELERLEKRIALLTKAANNPSTAENISKLETELTEAKRLERLGLGA